MAGRTCEVIEKNADYACDFIHREFAAEVTKPEGTYMLFTTASEFLKNTIWTSNSLKNAADVAAWQERCSFGEGCGPYQPRHAAR